MIFHLFESIFFSNGHKNIRIGIPDTATDPIIQDNGSADPDPSEIFTDPGAAYNMQEKLVIVAVFRIRSRIGSGFNQVSGSGSGIRLQIRVQEGIKWLTKIFY
jgi:hypothetical protein